MKPADDTTRKPLRSTREKADSCDALLAAARAGDGAALAALLELARPRARAVALKVLRNGSDADDAVQDALLKVWRNLPRFEGRASFFTWVHRIVMNACLDLRRREKVRGEVSEHDDGERGEPLHEPAHEETPEVLLQRSRAGALVRGALIGLSPAHREVIELRELEEYSYDEISREVRCPIGTVMSRLHHARRRLAGELQSRVAPRAGRLSEAA